VFVNISHNMREVKYFINLKTKENFISQFFVKDVQLLENISSLLQIQVVNNRIVALYKTQKLFIAIVNSEEIRKSNCFEFYIINMRKYKIILKLS